MTDAPQTGPDGAPLLIGMMGPNQHMLLQGVPHARELGMELLSVEPYRARLKVPYDPRLIGNPLTGVLHGGVITTLLDNTSGIAVFCAMTKFMSTATLDLRIDYMRPAEPWRDLIAEAHCYRITRNIAFVRGACFHDDPNDPIATSVATFMLASNSSRKKAKAAEGAA